MTSLRNTGTGFVRGSFAFLIILALGSLTFSETAWGATEDVYTVHGVPVDATAGEAAEARVIAIRQGRALALRYLFQRLTLEEDWSKLPRLETSEVTALGAGFEISNERNSPTRYLATITYRFKPNDVRKTLQQFDIPFSEVQARPMVVLPVFLKGEDAHVFQEDMNWSMAWADRNYSHELVPIFTPLGDLGDVIAAPIEAIREKDFAALSGFAERYGVQDILIAKMRHDEDQKPVIFEFVRLSPTESETWTLALPGLSEGQGASPEDGSSSTSGDVAQPRGSTGGLSPFEPISVDGLRDGDEGATNEPIEPAFDLSPAMEQAIDKGVARLQEDWKERTIIRFDDQATMIVSARFEDISQWLVIKRAMQATPNITDHRLVALSTGGAHMEWDTVGTAEQLALALAQHDVALEPGTIDELAETEKISKGAFVGGQMRDYSQQSQDGFGDGSWYDDQSGYDSGFGDDPSGASNQWDDSQNPWADQVDEPQVNEEDLQDRVEEPVQDFTDGSMSVDLAELYRSLPPLGRSKGRFFVEDEESAGPKFGNARPEFWIVRFAPKVEPEVWPTQEGAEGSAEGIEGEDGYGDDFVGEEPMEDEYGNDDFGGDDLSPSDGTF